MKRTQRGVTALAVTASVLTMTGVVGAGPAVASGAGYYVGGAGCSDSGSGSQGQPFCTISAAAAVAGAGDTVTVAPGTYNEQVTVANSGSAGSPVTFVSETPGAAVVTGGLHGFDVDGKSWVNISGFTINGTGAEGLYLANSSNLTVSANTITQSGHRVIGQNTAGVLLRNVSASLVTQNTSDDNSYYGFLLDSGTTGVTLLKNEASHNAEGWQRDANGIDVLSPGNFIYQNVLHDNEDSGLQFYPGGDNNVASGNVTYNNGDHGIDDLNVHGNVLTGNTVWNNCTDGINVEGTSSNFTVENNVSVDNAVNIQCIHGPQGADKSGRAGDIGIYDTATTGTTVDFNLAYQTQAGTRVFEWGPNGYTTLSAWQTGSGQGAHDLVANPSFSNPAAGDFRLREGSPAVDSANADAPNEQTTDIDGNQRVDDPYVANTGAGARDYDDRGAYEFQPSTVIWPTAALTATPCSGTAPVAVTVDASGSTEGSAAIVDYTFDFGDGTVVDAGGSPTATHTYANGRSYPVIVTVTDAIGLSDTALTVVHIAKPATLTAELTLSQTNGPAPMTVTADGSNSARASGPITGYTFDFGDGTVVGPQAAATAGHTYATPGTYTVTLTVTDASNNVSQATQTVTVLAPAGPTAALTLSPSKIIVPLAVVADATASTAGTSPIAGYTFDFGDGTAPVTVTSGKATHTYTKAGTFTVKVTVTDSASPTPATSQATGTVTAAAPSGPIRYIGRAAKENAQLTNTQSVVYMKSATKAGDALVMSVYLTGTTAGGPVTATDTQGDTFQTVADTADTSGHRTVVLAAFHAHALTSSDKITMGWPTATAHDIAVDEFAGISAVDQSVGASGPAGSFATGAVTTTAANELVFTAVGSASATSPAYAAGWLPLTAVSLTGSQVTPAYQPTTATGTFSATGTAAADWTAALVTFM